MRVAFRSSGCRVRVTAPSAQNFKRLSVAEFTRPAAHGPAEAQERSSPTKQDPPRQRAVSGLNYRLTLPTPSNPLLTTSSPKEPNHSPSIKMAGEYPTLRAVFAGDAALT